MSVKQHTVGVALPTRSAAPPRYRSRDANDNPRGRYAPSTGRACPGIFLDGGITTIMDPTADRLFQPVNRTGARVRL